LYSKFSDILLHRLILKVKVFTEMSKRASDDLARVLWLRSPNSEVWMLQRSNYTSSLAVMSMVGYILGLGDRHPSNLMLDRHTGKVIHIDFGDCFEVAMKREKYPEKIPFRLTRMLVNTMEVSGIEGTFRATCQNVMTVLREHSDSLMAVLEAFVHDPLLNWRILNTATTPSGPAPNDTTVTSTHQRTIRLTAPLLDSEEDSLFDSLSFRPSSGSSVPTSMESGADLDIMNQRALDILKRIKEKLCGRDFQPKQVLDVPKQVDHLILQATSVENLCQCYIGWCPFW